LESEIADRRELYNDTVTDYNNRIQTLPDAIVARAAGMTTPEPLFQAAGADREVVRVTMDGSTSPRSP